MSDAKSIDIETQRKNGGQKLNMDTVMGMNNQGAAGKLDKVMKGDKDIANSYDP